jgi:hypothetical protein
MKIRNIVFSLMLLATGSVFGAAIQPYDPAPEARRRLDAARRVIQAPSNYDQVSRGIAFVARGVVGATILHAVTARYFDQEMSFSMFLLLASVGGAIGDQIATHYPLQPSEAEYCRHALNTALVDLNTRTQERDDARQALHLLRQPQAGLNRPRNLDYCNIV